MADFFGSIWWFIVALGILVTFHEFGHFWVARRCGVKVLRFSVGFGNALLRRIGKDGVEYVVAAIPLGGYVKFLDEREAPVAEEDRDKAFNRQPLAARTAIVAAGPVFNLVLAVFAFWLMFMVGLPELKAVFAEPQGIAAQAGFRDGDEVVAVGGKPVETLSEAALEMLPYALDREPVEVTLHGYTDTAVNADADVEPPRNVTLAMDQLGDDFKEEQLLSELGLSFWQPPARISAFQENSSAEAAGLKVGDLVVAVGETPVENWGQMAEQMRELTQSLASAEDQSVDLSLQIERNGEQFRQSVAANRSDDGYFRVGISGPGTERIFTTVQSDPIPAVGKALAKTWDMIAMTFGLLRRMVTGDASLKNLSGPISIAQFADQSASRGVSHFLQFLAFLSLSLAILNFLPIPLLDGGHLLYYFIEGITGKPVSEQVQIVGQYIGLAALGALISLTFYNDILRLLA